MKVRHLLPLAGLIVVVAAILISGVYSNFSRPRQVIDKQTITAANHSEDKPESASAKEFNKGPWFEGKRLLLPAKLELITVYLNKEQHVLTPDDTAFTPIRDAAEQTIMSYNGLVMSADLVEMAVNSAKKGSTLIILHYGDNVTFEIKGKEGKEDSGGGTTNELFISLDGQPKNDNAIKGMFYVRHDEGLSAIGTAKPFTDLQAALKEI